MDRSSRLLHDQPRQQFEWNYFLLLTLKIVLSNKKIRENIQKFFFKAFSKKKKSYLANSVEAFFCTQQCLSGELICFCSRSWWSANVNLCFIHFQNSWIFYKNFDMLRSFVLPFVSDSKCHLHSILFAIWRLQTYFWWFSTFFTSPIKITHLFTINGDVFEALVV